MKTEHAWAIDTRSDEGHGLLGVFWFIRSGELLPYQDGMRTALFRTRQKARSHIKGCDIRRTFPRAKAVKVKVTISKSPLSDIDKKEGV